VALNINACIITALITCPTEGSYVFTCTEIIPNHLNLAQITCQVAHSKFQSVAAAYHHIGTTCDLAKKYSSPTVPVDVGPPAVWREPD
jgi:hypothetical protein